MKPPDYFTLMEEAKNTDLANWMAWSQEFSSKLREQGVSQDVIEGIELFDAGGSVQAPFRSANGIVPLACFNLAQGLALAKWLVEHFRDYSHVFRENANRLQALLLTLNQVESASDVAKGRKFRAGRSKGAKNEATKYIAHLVDLYPDKSTKELHKIALAEADTDSSPFGREDDDELWDKAKDKAMPFKTFSNKVSALKNPGSR